MESALSPFWWGEAPERPQDLCEAIDNDPTTEFSLGLQSLAEPWPSAGSRLGAFIGLTHYAS